MIMMMMNHVIWAVHWSDNTFWICQKGLHLGCVPTWFEGFVNFFWETLKKTTSRRSYNSGATEKICAFLASSPQPPKKLSCISDRMWTCIHRLHLPNVWVRTLKLTGSSLGPEISCSGRFIRIP
jgi:hypothetical protein